MAFLFKLLLAQTNRTLIAGLALLVILFTFCLFALKADGWHFGIIGVASLAVLSLRDIITALYRPKKTAFPAMPRKTNTPSQTPPSVKTNLPEMLATAAYLVATDEDIRQSALTGIRDSSENIRKNVICWVGQKYNLPDALKKAMNEHPVSPDILALYTGNVQMAVFICDFLKLADAVGNATNTRTTPL